MLKRSKKTERESTKQKGTVLLDILTECCNNFETT